MGHSALGLSLAVTTAPDRHGSLPSRLAAPLHELARDSGQHVPCGAGRDDAQCRQRRQRLLASLCANAVARTRGMDRRDHPACGERIAAADSLDVPHEVGPLHERTNQGQRQLPLAQIAKQGLARQARVAVVVEHVVDELKRDSYARSKVSESRDRGSRGAGYRRPRSCRPREQRSGLSSNDSKVDFLPQIELDPTAKLHDLAVYESSQGLEQFAQHAARRRRRGPLERVGEEQVSRENADRIAPPHACRRPTASFGPLVDHIVVQQGRKMHELSDGGGIASLRRNRTETRRREQDGQRPNALAATLEQVSRRVRRWGHAVARQPPELIVDGTHVVAQDRMDLGDAGGSADPGPFDGGSIAELRQGREYGFRDVQIILKLI